MPLIVCATSAFGHVVAPRNREQADGAHRGRDRRTTRRASRTSAASPRGRQAPGSPPSACRTAARSGRRRPEIADPGGRPRNAFPVLPLLQLAVARHDDDAAPRPRIASPRPSPCPSRGPCPSEPEFASMPGMPRSGCPSSPPSLRTAATAAPVGMDPERVQSCIEARHVVALGREEHVAVRMVPAELGDVQFAPEQMRRRCRAR